VYPSISTVLTNSMGYEVTYYLFICLLLFTCCFHSELSQRVIDTINNHEVVPLLVTLLKPTTAPSIIVLAGTQYWCDLKSLYNSGHCLLTVTEDNQTAIQWLSSNQEHLMSLESLLSYDQFTMATRTLIKSLVAGKLLPCFSGFWWKAKQKHDQTCDPGFKYLELKRH